MPIHLHFWENVFDFSRRIDDVRRAHDSHFLDPVHIFLLPYTVGFERLVPGVPRQRKIQLILVAKTGKLFHGVAAHPQNSRVEFIQFFFGVTELVRLARSTGGVSLGEKIKDEDLPLKIFQIYFVSSVGRQREFRCLVANV